MNKATDANNFIPAGIILLALTPAIMVLLPWEFGPDSTDFRYYMRSNSFPATVAELLVVLIAITRGFAPAAAFASLSVLAKVGLSMLAAGAAWTTMFVAVQPVMAALGIIKFFAHVMFALAMAHQFQVWNTAQRALVWPAIGAGVVAYCGLWALNATIYHPSGNDWIRLVPALTNIRWIGGFALASFCAGIGLLAIKPEPNARQWTLPVALLLGSTGLVLGLWTGTRAAIVAIFSAAIVASMLLPIRRQLLVYSFASMVIALAVTVALPTVHPLYGIERIVGAFFWPNGGGGITSGRLEIWADMIPKIIKRPIMGWGIDQFRYSFPEGTPSIRQPHHGLLQLLFSMGLFGLVASLLLATAFLQNSAKRFTETYQFASVAFIAGASAYSLYDGIFYFSYPTMTFLVAGCCLIGPSPSEDDRSD